MTLDEMWEEVSDTLDQAVDPKDCLAVGLNILTCYLELNNVTTLSADTGESTIVISIQENTGNLVVH
jgi:hypothetical protein